MTNKGKLFLIPNVIAENTQASVIPPQILNSIQGLRYFLVEDARTARRFLSSLKIFPSIENLEINVLNKDTSEKDMPLLMKALLDGEDVGVISESGCPGVADPGAIAVKYAHEKEIQVVPLVGPSSILLALMASGLNGQRFAFHGYLPIDAKDFSTTIKELEAESRKKNQTQIFIETPYRNNQVLDKLIRNLHSDTLLTIAIDITGSEEKIITKKVGAWKSQTMEMAKKPAIFLFLSHVSS